MLPFCKFACVFNFSFSQAKYKLYWPCVCWSKNVGLLTLLPVRAHVCASKLSYKRDSGPLLLSMIQQLLNVGFQDYVIVIDGGEALLLWSGNDSFCTWKLDSLHPAWPEGHDTLCCNTRDSLLLLFLDLWNLILPSFTIRALLPDLTQPGVFSTARLRHSDGPEEKSLPLPLTSPRLTTGTLISTFFWQQTSRGRRIWDIYTLEI